MGAKYNQEVQRRILHDGFQNNARESRRLRFFYQVDDQQEHEEIW